MSDRKTALIIDPFYIFRKILVDVIKISKKNVDIFEAQDAGKALDVLKNEHPDVVFLDIALPDFNGIDFITSIKEKIPESQIVVLTNHDSIEHKQASIKNGADYFISKERASGLRLLNIINSKL